MHDQAMLSSRMWQNACMWLILQAAASQEE